MRALMSSESLAAQPQSLMSLGLCSLSHGICGSPMRCDTQPSISTRRGWLLLRATDVPVCAALKAWTRDAVVQDNDVFCRRTRHGRGPGFDVFCCRTRVTQASMH